MTAAAAAAALAVTIAWTGTAAAAPGHPAKAAHGRLAAAHRASPPPPLKFASQFGGGQYVTVVKCTGGSTPPPIRLGGSAQPLTVSGSGPSATALKSASVPGAFKPAYLCTILVEKRLPAPVRKVPKKVVIETGFGGKAGAVAHHHPRG